MSASVYEIESIPESTLTNMKVIMCKGIGYVIVPKECPSHLIKRMGEVVAKTIDNDDMNHRNITLYPTFKEEYESWSWFKKLLFHLKGNYPEGW
jgi:hypothetical protein